MMTAPDMQERIARWTQSTRALAEEIARDLRGAPSDLKVKAAEVAEVLEKAVLYVELIADGQRARITIEFY
jgi:hypothetical protein